MYLVLASICFLSIILFILIILGFIFKPAVWKNNIKKIKTLCALWFIPYFIFIAFFTGPEDVKKYPPQENSPYRLPWESSVARLVAQGNRSFFSHRNLHLYAWDFVMPVGTPVLAARDGVVVHVEMEHDGIGYLANYISIEHEDGKRTNYAHLKKDSSFVKTGERVKQGQKIGLSGLVGQTWFPHLHFYATGENGQVPKPISFQEIPGGIPFAGRTYISENSSQ